ncbi:hypothetical protein ACFLYB_01490 [Chloroflexota bacterium]
MKTLFMIIAWIGIGIVTFGAMISFWTSWVMVMDSYRIGVDWGHTFGLLFGVLGLVFMLIGGLISKPRYFWLASIIVGSFYIISFFDIYQGLSSRLHDNQIDLLLIELAISVLPGLVAILEGIWLRRSVKLFKEMPK